MWTGDQQAAIHRGAKTQKLPGSTGAYSSGLEMKRAASVTSGSKPFWEKPQLRRLHNKQCESPLQCTPGCVCVCVSARRTCGWLVELRMRAHSSARRPVGQPCRLYCCAAALSCSCTTAASQKRDNKVNTMCFLNTMRLFHITDCTGCRARPVQS